MHTSDTDASGEHRPGLRDRSDGRARGLAAGVTLVLVGIGLLRVNTLVGFAGGFVTGIALVLTLAGVVVVAHHARAGDDQEQGGWWLPSRPEWWLPSEEATADDEVAGVPGTADDGDDR